MSCSTSPMRPAQDPLQLAADPTGPYPAECAKFDQFGVRVPFLAISPFAN